MAERETMFRTFVHSPSGLKAAVVPLSALKRSVPEDASEDDHNLIEAARRAQPTVSAPGYRCLSCAKQMKGRVSAILFAQLREGGNTEYHAVCARCGYGDGVVTAAVERPLPTYGLPG